MGSLIKYTGDEGEIFNKWLRSRLIEKNKNVISVELGGTGSGKSYRDLRKIELWYKFQFNKEVPLENICFGVDMIFQRLSSGKLKRGEILILEEAGVNLGSRNWQNKVSKMFNQILQSFRSMNIGIFMNLPYLSMLDSQARHLIHYYAESVGVDYEKKLNKCKPFFIQVAQSTGKIYRHYPNVVIDGKKKKIKRFNYGMPSKYLVDYYESEKQKFLNQNLKEYADKTNISNGKKPKVKIPREIEFEAYEMSKRGLEQKEIAKRLGKSDRTIRTYLKNVKIFLNPSKKE